MPEVSEFGLAFYDRVFDCLRARHQTACYAYHYEMPHALVSVGTGEMRKRYGFIHVDKYDDGTGTYERRRKDSFYAYQKIIKSNGAEGLD